MPQKWILEDIINELNKAREYFNKYDQLDDEFKSDYSKKDFWWQMIQLLPSSYNQTRNVMMNYEVLANIYKSRNNHKLDEWRIHEIPEEHKFRNKDFTSGKWGFCDWIESLPYSELICGPEFLRKKIDIPDCKKYTPQEYSKENPEWSKKIEEKAYSGLT